ncbi:MAG: Rieske (2Fe-2S) protein, partial [Candidatus Eremiobacteraeota bacterium]|nr:Rieske (2Fe-2S) protein [Candidatus Eremiobacteraeota bacterium]
MAERALEISLPRRAYWDDGFFQRERENIFFDQWFYAGRAERLAERGSFAVLDIAGESIIVVKDRSEALHAHLNLCRHRGSRLLCGEGLLRGAIRCPYHGWAYALDGTLVATPFLDDEDVPSEARRLHPVGVGVWAGF